MAFVSNFLRLQIVLWTSGIVVLSLLINAPLIPLLLRLTGLCDISAIKVKHQQTTFLGFGLMSKFQASKGA